MKTHNILLVLTLAVSLASCSKKAFDVNSNLTYCDTQTKRTLSEISGKDMMPRNIPADKTEWSLRKISIHEWTIGFWPGILWYNYENTGNAADAEAATYYTDLLEPITALSADNHDLGFQILCSYGNGYRLTGNEKYKQIILNAADTLATLFNPNTGTILSWPSQARNGRFGPFNTIVDNMMNLEMLYWAAKNGGTKELYDVATRHAETTMKNHFREDGGSYHVALYDPETGEFLKGVTHQGYADNSVWARGQAWAIYGFTMVYRETGDEKFLRHAEKITDLFLSRLPEGEYVPFWDFDAPDIPNTVRDSSAAAIVASALLELSQLENNTQKAKEYAQAASNILAELSSEKFQSRESKPSFLLHATGHYPGNSEIDVSINYGDYYYIEALTRYNKMKTGLKVTDNYTK